MDNGFKQLSHVGVTDIHLEDVFYFVKRFRSNADMVTFINCVLAGELFHWHSYRIFLYL